MASSNDLTELAALLKLKRKRTRKAEEKAEATKALRTEGTTSATPLIEAERFADYFNVRPWSEYRAPDAADIALFRNSVKGATPVNNAATADLRRAKPQPIAAQRNADELAALEASQLAMHPSPMSWDIGADIEDEQSFLRGGVNPDLLRKLRRGQWTINAEIDLHNHTQDEAHEALMAFMRAARVSGHRCVRIIHGKGLSSHQKIPVLRNKVRRWLQQKDEVIAYCEPRPNGGGSGAVLVLLSGLR